ncbi:hypothetical protein [Oceanicoccus sp. KOV_DT_Chl]
MDGTQDWLLYTQALALTSPLTLTSKAVRYGWQESETATFNH